MKIENYLLRGCYPNYRLLIHALENRHEHHSLPEMPGYLPAEVEYRLAGEKENRLMNIRYEDMIYLSSISEGKEEYFQLIIDARNNNIEAKKILKSISKAFFRKKNNEINVTICYEDEHVIPSVSNTHYDENLISHKGVKLLTLSQKYYPVPDFCILSSKTYLLDCKQREPYLKKALRNLEIMTSNTLGSAENPLIFAIRCAMPQYIPGLMPTYLNVGVTKDVYEGLKKIYGCDVAAKIYLQNLKTIYSLIHPFDYMPTHDELMLEIDQKISEFYDSIACFDERILLDVQYQIRFLIKTTKQFYLDNQDLLYTFVKKGVHYPSLILQKMVWTVRGDDSYPGVLYSRHSRTGLGVQIESVRDIFGEDIMTGMVNADDTEYFNREEIKQCFPEVYHFDPLLVRLEKRLASPVTIEFAAESIENEHYFAVLQLNCSEVTGRAMILAAMDLYKKGIINGKRVLELIHPYHLTQIFSDRIDDHSFNNLQFFSYGVSILPRSAVSAKAYFSASKALEAKKRGEKVCFCKESFVPSDTIVLSEVDAIVSLTPAAIHVVTACKGYGIPAFLNLEREEVTLAENLLINNHGIKIKEGDWITLSSKQKSIFIGRANYKPARLKRYLAGEKFYLEPKEEKVFINLSEAYKGYQQIIGDLQTEEIVKLNDLIRLIKNELRDEPVRSEKLVNNWYENNSQQYVNQILNSELGTHQDQHTVYSMLSLDKKIDFFKKIIAICWDRGVKGYTAGSFMLGRFICISHPAQFWEKFDSKEIAFLLNESILFEKYLFLLNDVGERHISRARKKILNDGLASIQLSISNAKDFISLKLISIDWAEIKDSVCSDYDKGVITLIKILEKPFGELYDYEASWSINELKEICAKENVPFPDPDTV